VALQQFDRRLGQQRAQAEAHVGAVPQLGQRGRHRRRQALAAMRGVGRHCVPAAGDELPVGVGEARRGADHAVLQPRRVLVADPVQRGEDLAGEPSGLLERGVDVLGRMPVAGLGQDLAEPEHAVEQEAQVGQRRGVGGGGGGGHGRHHRQNPRRPQPGARRRRSPPEDRVAKT
jgi:hypothetical protein